MRLICIVIYCLFSIASGTAQDGLESLLSFEEYMKIVRENHPLAYQADLLDDMADGRERMARGEFDPKVEAFWDQKDFKDTDYWSVASGSIKVPTWYGIEVKAGYDWNRGDFLSNSDNLPSRGLWNAGISVPLGRGLVIDHRRAELQRADIFRSSTEQEQIVMINELFYEAAEAYLNWQVATEFVNIAQEGLDLAEIRLQGTVSSFIQGDKPAIDTLESFISLQNRQQDLLKADQELQNARLDIDNFLWINGEVPLELTDEAVPDLLLQEQLQVTVDSLSLMQDQWLASHPELLLYDFKIQDLTVDERMAKEDLKPDLRVSYNPLIGTTQNALFDEFRLDQYKLAATFAYPILQRKERGKLQMTRVKIQDTRLDQDMKRQSLRVKLDMYLNNMRATSDQIFLLEATIANYLRMLQAENRKFEIGESSIFLINSREIKYLESRYKLIETRRKLIDNRYIYLLLSGQMRNVL